MYIQTKILEALGLLDSNIGTWGHEKLLEEMVLRGCSYEMLLSH